MKSKGQLIILFFVLSAFCFIGGIKIFRTAISTLKWVSVDGIIIESEKSYIEKGRRSEKTFYAKIVYKYNVNNKEYIGDNVSFKDFNKPIEDTLNKYYKGKIVKVYYNPDNPEESVLEPGVSWQSYQALGLGVIFAIAGIILIFIKFKN